MFLTNIIKIAKVKSVDNLKWQAKTSWQLVFFNKYFFSGGKLRKLKRLK